MDVSLYRIKLMAGLGEHLCSTLKIALPECREYLRMPVELFEQKCQQSGDECDAFAADPRERGSSLVRQHPNLSSFSPRLRSSSRSFSWSISLVPSDSSVSFSASLLSRPP